MLIARRCSRSFSRLILSSSKHSATGITRGTDSCGIPLQPLWSVNELLSSCPTPSISPTALKRIHELSALTLPEEGTLEYRRMKRELEELVKLVEAVKLVDTCEVRVAHVHERDVMDGCTADITETQKLENSGRALLGYTARTSDGFYEVDADKK